MINRHHRWLLSGGIGSGKSLVRRVLSDAGWHAVDADAVGHSVLERDSPAFSEVASRWPRVVVDGRIDRALLGQIVFSNTSELKALEQITHPLIFGKIVEDIQGIRGPIVVEIPLLHHRFGSGWGSMVVDCCESLRLDRLVKRGLSKNAAVERMRVQPSRGEWLAAADLVIPNFGTVDELIAAVTAVVGS